MRLAYCVLTCLTLASALRAGPLLERPTPATNAVDFGSIRLDPVQSITLAPGEWASSITYSYLNQFNLSWHTRKVHAERGLSRVAITAEELRFIEQEFVGDDVYLLDIEGWRTDVSVSRGLGNGTTLTVELPYIDIGGGPNLDAIAEDVHGLFSSRTFGRDAFPRGANVVYFHSNEATYESLDARGSGLGDVTVSLSKPLHVGPFEQVVAISAQLPTGDEKTLRGSGGWDAGLRWFGKWRGERRSWIIGAGASWLDDSGSFVGFERNWTWSLLGEVVQPLRRGGWVRLGTRIDRSPIERAFDDNGLEEVTVFYRLGYGRALGGGSLFFDLGEQILPQTGIEADWSIHLGWSTTLKR